MELEHYPMNYSIVGKSTGVIKSIDRRRPSCNPMPIPSVGPDKQVSLFADKPSHFPPGVRSINRGSLRALINTSSSAGGLSTGTCFYTGTGTSVE